VEVSRVRGLVSKGRDRLNVTRGLARNTTEYAIIIARSSKYKVMERRVHGKDAEARFFEVRQLCRSA
jgi:hypothetical protein